ncbi:MAG: hypothetical protein JJU34_02035 [Lunatimonas sp.]|uniref:2'-5' RNA ligase family protein n=1 Tax=Lunatimonas sp. TaxID=2060141 RepID=UPI00263B086D|nr:hypothetical protein [Lunatimonas sp.]MCC5936038.1 hypothetical protein [Lunatimonas sp.]
MDLRAHYDMLNLEARRAVELAGFDFDTQINDPHDDRRGLTLLFRPDEALANSFGGFTSAIQDVLPGHYYYSRSDFHVTVMPIVSCYSGFSCDGLDLDAYRSLIQDAIAGVGSIPIQFTGVFMSPSCLMIRGYPQNNELEKLRNNLRVAFGGSNLERSLDKRYKLVTAHCTVVRFQQEVVAPAAFWEVMQHFSAFDFGMQVFEDLEFVFNDWYQRVELVKRLANFKLGE